MVIALLLSLVPSAIAQQFPPSRARANAEGSDRVRTQIEEGTEITVVRKGQSTREVLVRQRGACFEDAGEFGWFGALPPSTRQFPPSGTSTEALYQRIRIDPDGSRTAMGIECRPIPRAQG